ncbi:MAG: CHAP domain-containing protein [Ruminococcus sp.]|nr:CHAP domain-containing protein [Ruminococcus sp.]
MSQRSKFLDFARSQVGTIGGDKYRAWYNKNVGNIGSTKWAWCAAGISYCANQVGVSKSVIIPTASAPAMLHNFQNAKRFKARGSYTPTGGDIIIFKYAYNTTSDASHVGIVEKVENGYVHTIEFNSGSLSDGAVARWKYSLSSSIIVGYGVPKFKNNVKTVRSGRIRKKPWRDPKGGTSKTLKILPVGAELEYLEDDGYGWGKVKSGDITGYIQNNRLDSENTSRFHKATVLLTQRVKTVATGEKKTVQKGDTVKFICEIEKGKYKGTAIISVDGTTCFIKSSDIKVK